MQSPWAQMASVPVVIRTSELKSFHLYRNAILVKYIFVLSIYFLLDFSLPSRDIIADSIEAV